MAGRSPNGGTRKPGGRGGAAPRSSHEAAARSRSRRAGAATSRSARDPARSRSVLPGRLSSPSAVPATAGSRPPDSAPLDGDFAARPAECSPVRRATPGAPLPGASLPGPPLAGPLPPEPRPRPGPASEAAGVAARGTLARSPGSRPPPPALVQPPTIARRPVTSTAGQSAGPPCSAVPAVPNSSPRRRTTPMDSTRAARILMPIDIYTSSRLLANTPATSSTSAAVMRRALDRITCALPRPGSRRAIR
jgi:hypothetical protein